MTKIGQYEIMYELGRGDVSIVYLAYDAVACREVAVKMICLPESFSEEQKQEYRAGFLREAKASLSLNHAGIVTTYYCHDQGNEGEPYTSMEYVAGKSLKALFESAECREPGDVFAVVEATTDALHAAHRVGVFHGDVRPANILVRRSDDAVKIGDFGIGRFPPAADSAAYMAPECQDGSPADARSDLFSLAVILYEGLCGKLPFQGDDAKSTMTAVMHSKPDPVTECAPGMPTSVDGFFLRALAKDPDHRFPDGMSFLEELLFVRKDYEASRQGVPLVSMEPDVARVADAPEPEAAPELSPEQSVDDPPVAIEEPTAKADWRWLMPAGIAAAVALSFFSGWLIRGGDTEAEAEPAPQRLLSSLEQSAPERSTGDGPNLTTTYDGDPRRWELVGEPGSLDAASVVELAGDDGSEGNAQPEPQPESPALDAPADEPAGSISIQVVEPLLKPMKTPQPSKVAEVPESTRPAPAKPVVVPEPAVQEEAPSFLSQAVAEPVPSSAAPVQSGLTQSAQIAPGHLVVEIRSSIKKGTLFLFVDEELILKQPLAAEGGLMKRMVKKGEGSLEHFDTQLEIPTGEHKLHALVHRSGKEEWRETLVLQVESAQTYSVLAKLGRMMGFGGGISLNLESGVEAGLTATPEGL